MCLAELPYFQVLYKTKTAIVMAKIPTITVFIFTIMLTYVCGITIAKNSVIELYDVVINEPYLNQCGLIQVYEKDKYYHLPMPYINLKWNLNTNISDLKNVFKSTGCRLHLLIFENTGNVINYLMQVG